MALDHNRLSDTRLSEVIRHSTSDTLAKGTTPATKTPGSGQGGDIYNIAYDGEVPNPWSRPYIGIPIHYMCVGMIYGGSVRLLYPVLVVKERVSASFNTAARQLVTLFWSYKIFFGIISDCFPILSLRRKPYIILGWSLCATALIALAINGNSVNAKGLVIMLTAANFGYVLAVVASDAFMVWMAHREPIERRGRVQTLIYICREAFRIVSALILLFGFSGPQIACPGWEEGDELCPKAVFTFSLTIAQYAWILAGWNLVCLPAFFFLREEKTTREKFTDKIAAFWHILQNRAVWQVILYTVVSNILFGVSNSATEITNSEWLGLSPFQSQIMGILESLVLFLGMNLYRSYGLNFSWRMMIAIGSLIQIFFQFLYLLIVYDIWREPWFYVFTDVSVTFTSTLNFLAGVFYIVEVSEPGFEAITYALITTTNNAVGPLSSVISNQLISSYPTLASADALAADTPEIRNDYLYLMLTVVAINFSSLFSLPMLPKQKKEARELLARGETSKKWAAFCVISVTIILIYSTIITFGTVLGAGTSFECYRILGGAGCEGESRVPVLLLLAFVFCYCYGIIIYFCLVPWIKKKMGRT